MNQNKFDNYFDYLGKRSLHGLLYRRLYLHPHLVKHLPGNTLDVGCGIGDFVKYDKSTIGLEINPSLVKYCQSNGLDVRLIEGEKYPFGDNTFSSVLLDNVLEHLENPNPTLEEITRVLVPGGSFVVVVPGLKGYAADDDHKIFYEEEGLRDLMRKYGYKEKHMLYTPVKSKWLSANVSAYCIYAVFSLPG